MRASHDTMMVKLRVVGSGGARATNERPLVVAAGCTVHQFLDELLDLAFDDLTVTVNGQSARRLRPLLHGDLIVISHAPCERPQRRD